MTKATETAVKTLVEKAVNAFSEKVVKKVDLAYKVHIKPFATHFGEYLKRAYREYDVANTLAFSNQGKRLRDIYFPLTLVREGIPTPGEKDEYKIDAYPDDLFSVRKKVLIRDTAGMGKSTVSKFLFLEAIDKEKGIPFFVDLRNLSQENSILNEITRQLESLTKSFDQDLLRALLKNWEGNFIFFLDGYDEIAQSQRGVVTDNLKDFIGQVGDNTFILTSRADSALPSFGDFVSYRIRSLTADESYGLLRKYDSNGETSAKLVEKIKSVKDDRISAFLENPLLTSLLFIGYNPETEFPTEVHQFYYQVYEALFNAHDQSKDGIFVHEKESHCSCEEFARFLRAFAYICFQEKGSPSFTNEEFVHYIEKAQSLSGVTGCGADSLRNDLLRAVPLLLKEGPWVRWVHKSFMDYFTAAYLRWEHPDKDDYLRELLDSQDITNSIPMLDFFADMDEPAFKKNLVLPVLKEFVDFMERPVDFTDDREQVKRVMRRRQLLFHRDTYLHLFDVESDDFSFSAMGEIIEKEKPAGSAPALWHNWGDTMKMISMTVCDSRFELLQLIIVHYPDLYIRYKWKDDPEPFTNHIPTSRLHHYTEDFMLEYPDNYDRLDSLDLEGTRVMGRDFIPDYKEAKRMLAELQSSQK